MFHHWETVGTILEGFTITNGAGQPHPFLRGSLVGGGIYCANGTSPLLKNLIIRANTSVHGGGIFNDGGTLHLENSTIINNEAVQIGGGIYIYQGDAEITNCMILNNDALNADGGGIYCYDSDVVTIKDSKILSNSCALWGGGIASIFSKDLTITNTIIASNTAQLTGGGVAMFYTGSLKMVNNTIFENEAVLGMGGGFYVSSPNIVPVQSTIVNTILYNNKAPTGNSGAMNAVDLDVTYCNVEGGSASISQMTSNGTLNYGVGNISDEPFFFNSFSNDFHLITISGGVDMGDNNAAGLPDKDNEGDDRINGNAVDIGADELYDPYFYFTGNITQGQTFNMNIIGKPKASPLIVFVGSGVNSTPDKFGFMLKAPIKTVVLPGLSLFPVYGVLMIPGLVLPAAPILPVGLSFPMQMLVGKKVTPVTTFTIE